MLVSQREGNRMTKPHRSALRLPKGWKNRVRMAVLEVISLAKYSLSQSHGWAANHVTPGVRLKADH